jgi:hypothetical protein
MRVTDNVARAGLLLAGLFLFCRTVQGLIFLIGIGADSAQSLVATFCVIAAFPVFLIGLWSLRSAAIGLWIYLVAQWIDRCLVSKPPAIINPLDSPHAYALLASVVFVQVGYLLLRRDRGDGRPISLREAYVGHAGM